MDLPVIYAYDDEVDSWGFRVPALRIVGGGKTREEAEARAREAILFTLNDDPGELLPGEEVGYVRVTVERAPVAQHA